MSKLFRGCRYEVLVHVPNEHLWSRHSSIKAARKAYREAVNNRRGDHSAGTLVKLVDIFDGGPRILERAVVQA